MMTYQDMRYTGGGGTTGTHADRPTGLIVDDCIVTRQLLESMLRDTPVQILGAADSVEQAGRLISSLRPDIVFVDMLVLGGKANEALAFLRGLAPGLKTVLSTTHARRHAVEFGYLPKADEYLLRPYHRDRVTERVRGLCGRPREQS